MGEGMREGGGIRKLKINVIYFSCHQKESMSFAW